MKVQMKLNHIGYSSHPVKKIDPYKTTLDLAVVEVDHRFSKNTYLYKDLAFLEPRRFSEMQEQLGKDPTPLSKIAKMSEVSLGQLREELQSFSHVYKEICSTAMIEMAPSIHEEESVEEYLEISEQLEEEGFIAAIPSNTTAVVRTEHHRDSCPMPKKKRAL